MQVKDENCSKSGKNMGTAFMYYRRMLKLSLENVDDTLLELLKKALNPQRPHLPQKKSYFHRANSSADTSSVVSAKWLELCFELRPYASFSTDYPSKQLFPVPNLNKWFPWRRFRRSMKLEKWWIACVGSKLPCWKNENGKKPLSCQADRFPNHLPVTQPCVYQ